MMHWGKQKQAMSSWMRPSKMLFVDKRGHVWSASQLLRGQWDVADEELFHQRLRMQLMLTSILWMLRTEIQFLPSTTLVLSRVRMMDMDSSLKQLDLILLATLLPTHHVIYSTENLSKLGVHTKLIQCDGTFRTAPSTVTGRFYQNLMLHAKYFGHVLPFFKVVMTGKSGVLYNTVFQKIKVELPSSVSPETVMCDFEPALQNGLQAIFPDAIITGCWFHYSQVSEPTFFC